MLRNIGFFLILLFVSGLKAQVSHSVIFESSYRDLGIVPRIENDGIIGIRSFDVADSRVSFTLDGNEVLTLSPGIMSRKNLGSGETDFLFDTELPQGNDHYYPSLKTIYLNGKKEAFTDEGGILKGSDGSVSVQYKNRSHLDIHSTLQGIERTTTLSFPGDLACADFIGIDKNGNTFILIEKYVTDIPLVIDRYIYLINSRGESRPLLRLPAIKYISLVNEFRIDEDGNFYHLLTAENGLQIIKWSGLTVDNSINSYPSEYNFICHYNNYTSTKEAAGTPPVNSPLIATSRVKAIRTGETYVYYKYNIAPANLAVNNTTAPDGDLVRTPPWLITGRNARIPYKWGGFNTLAQIYDGLLANKFAGDIHTDGVTSYAVGVDCSGFVSRCWQLTYHASTSYMPNITTQYASWDSIKPGDAIHKVGHVRLYLERNTNGSFKVVESAGRNWDVSFWSFLASDLTTYTPRFYNAMEDDFANGSPDIISAIMLPGGQIELSWSADTTGISGYRLYKSFDGVNFALLMDESVLKNDNIVIAKDNNPAFYRVARVLNRTSAPESNWSNAVSAFTANAAKKYLIIDGFSREIGSWQGPGHNFAVNYAKALSAVNASYDFIKSSYLEALSINLADYFGILWIAGDESTTEESFSASEQSLIKNYLETGGNFFVSGSEIGWDLFSRGNAADKLFYNDYLKASFLADDAGALFVKGQDSTSMQGAFFYFGQTYEEDFPDVIGEYGGSKVCLKYSNNLGAGIQYAGTFGSSPQIGKVIYFGFPLETTANDSSFNQVIRNADTYFSSPFTSVDTEADRVSLNRLYQNYPNPFSSATTIKYTVVPEHGKEKVSREAMNNVTLKIFDILGREIETIVNTQLPAGEYDASFESHTLPSGIYYFELTSGSFRSVRKMLLIR
ncbi:MAG: T9SS type A sorting domain-containing protein [Ignavibacteriaceae bacterium]|nr:T9SS type A sorting domain-containing protein [Ignavibacteriaceae bacterium]